MKKYLVGGAVRDKLLNYPVKEHDWVVVGATPEQMIAQGYKKVGRDFPVFIHPHSKEEHALARTERKRGTGYYGFACDFNSSVTLEEDLARRDLTINAMAMDNEGRIIDPFHGKSDLELKILRHVSPAFIEDPVRVLRVARFAARYHHLGFTLANETRELMYKMVKAGELLHLVPERVWQEWEKSLSEQNPEIFITVLRDCGALEVVFPEINALFGVPTRLPKVDCGINALNTLRKARMVSKNPIIRFAALLHHIDYGNVPPLNWPISYQSDFDTGEYVKILCDRLRIPVEYRNLAVMCARFHFKIHQLGAMNSEDIVLLLEQCDVFRRPSQFDNLLEICDIIDKTSVSCWQELKQACENLSVQDIISKGFKGADIKVQLHLMRVVCVTQILKKWEK